MRWRTYPKYRDSGIEWLGGIPQHWDVKRLKYCATVNMGQSPDSGDCNADGFGMPFLQGCAEFGSRSPSPRLYCDVARKVARQGDLLISVRAPVGALNVADQDFGIGRGLCGIRTNAPVLTPAYCWYLLAHAREQLSYGATGSTYDAVSAADVANMLILLPESDDQGAIAAFLDRETARIDALIEKKRRQIELLQEKRAALITQAVTKGLDPNAPMKDSGVEWLGEIPAHWEILPLKRIARIRYGLGQPPKETTGGLPLLRATNISRGRITSEGMMFVDPEDVPASRGAELSAGEIIVVRSGAYTGDSAIVPREYQGAIAGYDMIVTVQRGVAQFVAWQLLAPIVCDLQFGHHRSRAAQPHLNAEELGGTIIVLPPRDEQLAIHTELAQETSRVDALVVRLHQSIDLLREYRTALISAVVTGKIDVREEVT